MPPADASVRPLRKQVLLLLRRGHLYCGLFLLPWAILYGVTAFLFNHPTAFSDHPTATFGLAAVAGTPLESYPSAAEQAADVIRLMNEKQKPAVPYSLGVGEVKYAREFAFATVKTDGQTVGLLLDVKNGGGTIRVTPDTPVVEHPPAPFADSPTRSPRPAPKSGTAAASGGKPLTLDNPLHERFKAAIPTILERTGFPTGEVTVTSVPDLVFPVVADGRTWTASYNPMTGALSGKPAEAEVKPDLSPRRFLLRLHTAHGYPGETNARWYWAVVVDAMAVVMVFWGLTGLLMWWQIKAARRAGAVVLTLSAVAATALGFAMHAAMTR